MAVVTKTGAVLFQDDGYIVSSYTLKALRAEAQVAARYFNKGRARSQRAKISNLWIEIRKECTRCIVSLTTPDNVTRQRTVLL